MMPHRKIHLPISGCDWYLQPINNPDELPGNGKALFRTSSEEIYKNNPHFVFGVEGFLILDQELHFSPSLMDLPTRSRQLGRPKIIVSRHRQEKKLQYLVRSSRQRYRTLLHYIFSENIFSSSIICAFEDQLGNFQAAVSATETAPGRYYIDQFCRTPKAPSGAMESLIIKMVFYLRESGATELSLGEVPFLPAFGHRSRNTFPMRTGKALIDRSYSIMGLYRFKNKFAPVWRPSVIAGHPSLSGLAVAELLQKSKMGYLMLESAWKRINKLKKRTA